MTDIVRALIVLAVLLLFVLLPNIIIVKEHRVHVVERLGTYHRSLDQKGVYWTIPIIERVIQVVPTDIQTRHLLINKQDKKGPSIHYTYQVTDVMRYVYQTLDAKKDMDDLLRTLYLNQTSTDLIDPSTIETDLETIGIKLIGIHYDNQ